MKGILGDGLNMIIKIKFKLKVFLNSKKIKSIFLKIVFYKWLKDL
jgi:hypothetical protein